MLDDQAVEKRVHFSHLGMGAVAVLLLAVLFLLFSDCSDASSDLPDLDVRSAETDTSLSGTGAILDDAVLDVTVNSDRNSKNFFVSSGTVLVSGETYLIINGTSGTSYSLMGSIFGMTPSECVFGLRFSLYEDPGCSGTPVASAAFYDQNTQIIKEGLSSGHKYYIKVETDKDATFADAPYLGYPGFKLTATTEADYNAVYYVSDGVSQGSMLVRNGEQYSFPEVSKEGYVLVGWYDDPAGGKCYSSGDTVSQDSDITLYAHWTEGSDDHVHYVLPDGSEIFIDKETSEGKVTVKVRAFSADGRITLDTGVTDLSALTDLNYTLHIGSEGDAFSTADASVCIAMDSSIKGWLEKQHQAVDSHLEATTAGSLICDRSAIRTIASSGFDLKMINGPSNASVFFDNASLEAVSDKASSSDDPVQCTLVIREATASDLTKAQADVIGKSTAWVIGVFAGGVEIHDLGGGKVTAVFPFEPSKSNLEVKVCCVSEDGHREDVVSAYENGSVTLSLVHFSIYMGYGEEPDHTGWMLMAAVFAPIVIIIVVLGVRSASSRDGE